jgi:hypothetical protein
MTRLTDAPIDEVVERLTIHSAHYPDLRALLSAYQSVREDAARLHWLSSTLESAVGGGVEVNDDRLVYLEPEKGKEVRVFWYPETPVGFTQFFGSTIREAIDRARTGGTE